LLILGINVDIDYSFHERQNTGSNTYIIMLFSVARLVTYVFLVD